MTHSAEKCKRGDPFGFLKLQFVAKYQKFEGGTSETKVTEPKKIQRVSSGFVSYAKSKINEEGTLYTILDAFPLAGPVV